MNMPVNRLYFLSLLLIKLGLVPAYAAESCTLPGQGGATCGSGGPASGGNDSGTNQGAGNPIDLISGNKYQREADLPALPGLLGLEVIRHYNSTQAQGPGWGLGRGWRLSYDTRLVPYARSLRIDEAEGRRVDFQLSPLHPDQFLTSNLAQGKIAYLRRAETYAWVQATGRTLRFDKRGFLQSISAASGETVSLSRDAQGRLIGVRDPMGRSLSLRYNRAGQIESITTPLGPIRYRYGGVQLGNLVQAQGLGQHRHYHYEDKRFVGMLTGISAQASALTKAPAIADQQARNQAADQVGLIRLNTWAYDAAGLAVMSVKGRPLAPTPANPATTQLGKDLESTTAKQNVGGIEEIHLQHEFGRTTLRNSLGQITVYRHTKIQGQPRLLEAIGPGCSSCSPGNRRYRYDAQGRLLEEIRLNAQGQAQTGERRSYDTMGRILRLSQVSYHGKQEQERLIRRYEYGFELVAAQDPQLAALRIAYDHPAEILRPSVIPGREARISLRYNPQGQITERHEHGYSPLDPQGQPLAQGAEPQVIQRSSHYRYQTRAGHSLLSEIDGPLANGPKSAPEDSDMTRLDWDAKGVAITHIQAPGGMHWHYGYTELGLPTVQTLDDGFRRIQTHWEWASEGVRSAQLLRISRKAWQLQGGQLVASSQREQQVLQARYDSMGRRIAYQQEGEPSKEMSYDTLGRPQSLSDAHGQKLSWAYDREGRLLAEMEQSPAGQVLHARAWLRDSEGRLLATLTPGKIEQLQGLLLPAGLAAAEMRSVSQATTETTALPLSLRDDFGREVLQHEPEDGHTSTTFESRVLDGRSVEMQRQRRTGVDGKAQTQESLTFDLAGRLIRRERGDEHSRCVDQLRYEGQLLVQLLGCTAEERFERNALGLITRRQMLMKTANAGFDERYRYDEHNRLSERELPDGQVLRYAYVAGVKATGNTAPAISRLLPWLNQLYRWHPDLALSLAHYLPQSWSTEALLSETQVTHQLHAPSQLAAILHGNGERTAWVRTKTRTNADDRPQILAMASFTPAVMPALQVPADVDAFGRQTRLVPAGGPHKGQILHLQWNAQRQLAAVRTAQGLPVADYAYDASGNRIRKTVYDARQRPRVTLFRYDTQHRLSAIADEQGHVQQQILYTDHRAHTLLQGDESLAVHTDWRGLPQRLSDAHATTKWEGRFTDGGLLQGNASPADPGLRLAGQVNDEETGLHYNVYRYYDPVNMRYISPDPLGAPDGPARYAYVRGRPMDGIDPLGLFEIPVGYLIGNPATGSLDPDEGHGDIVRTAFGLYSQRTGNRFSMDIINQVIRNNYQTDNARSDYRGGQYVHTNHFDNPNVDAAGAPFEVEEKVDPVTGKKTMVSTGKWRTTYTNKDWIKEGVDDLNKERNYYHHVLDNGEDGVDLSVMLGSFGRNSHALADFYAHSNWVDNKERGGCWARKAGEKGWVPQGLAKTEIWDESTSITPNGLFSATVDGLSEIKVTSKDKSSHAYWGKDTDTVRADEVEFTQTETSGFNKNKKFFWVVKIFDPSRKGFDPSKKKDYKGCGAKEEGQFIPINGASCGSLVKGQLVAIAQPITNHHRMAFHLAIEHTIKEIESLWNGAASIPLGSTGITLQSAFSMDAAALRSNSIKFKDLWPKDGRPK